MPFGRARHRHTCATLIRTHMAPRSSIVTISYPPCHRPCCERRRRRGGRRHHAAQLPPDVRRRNVPPRRPGVRRLLGSAVAMARQSCIAAIEDPRSEAPRWRRRRRCIALSARIDRPILYLAVSPFVRQKHVEAGVPPDRIRVKSNFAWPLDVREGARRLLPDPRTTLGREGSRSDRCRLAKESGQPDRRW